MMEYQVIIVIVLGVLAAGFVIKTLIKQFSSSENHAKCEKCCQTKPDSDK